VELCETVPQIHGMPGPVSVGSRVSRVAVSLISVILGSWLTQATNASAQAAHWTSNGPQGGTINSIAIDPRTPDTLYVGTGSGVFRSADGGVSWTALSLAGVVYALAIDPLTPATLYAGTDSGLFKSINAGSSWNSMSSRVSGKRPCDRSPDAHDGLCCCGARYLQEYQWRCNLERRKQRDTSRRYVRPHVRSSPGD